MTHRLWGFSVSLAGSESLARSETKLILTLISSWLKLWSVLYNPPQIKQSRCQCNDGFQIFLHQFSVEFNNTFSLNKSELWICKIIRSSLFIYVLLSATRWWIMVSYWSCSQLFLLRFQLTRNFGLFYAFFMKCDLFQSKLSSQKF